MSIAFVELRIRRSAFNVKDYDKNFVSLRVPHRYYQIGTHFSFINIRTVRVLGQNHVESSSYVVSVRNIYIIGMELPGFGIRGHSRDGAYLDSRDRTWAVFCLASLRTVWGSRGSGAYSSASRRTSSSRASMSILRYAVDISGGPTAAGPCRGSLT